MPDVMCPSGHRRHRTSSEVLNDLSPLRVCVNHGWSEVEFISEYPFSHLSMAVSPGPHGDRERHLPPSHALPFVGSRRSRERNPTKGR